ncbi:hypothetical protein [uncultured Chryseobacterium sp.]|uniref:hypothetical protein n=1 Tax=uncultured Chryseobacterium sp. TaxID=259322 RepID=UPI0025F4B353|nr:hypothetical protein [uncultured Chryseobacterium sp.]
MSTNENTPISGQFWDWMQSYWHTNRSFQPAHPDWRKKADLVNGKVPAGQLPSYVDDVMEFSSYTDLPQPGEKGKIYITTKDNKQFRWGGSAYIEISSDENVMTLSTEQSVSGRKYFVTSNGSDILNQKFWLRSFDGSNPAAVYYKDGYGSGALGFDGDEFRLTNIGASASAYLNTKGIKKDGSNNDYVLTGGGGHTLKNDLGTSHTHQILFSSDTGDLDANSLLKDYKLTFNQRVERGSTNMFPMIDNANAVLSIASHPGGYGGQLGFNDNGQVFFRGVSAGNYGTWSQFAFKGWVENQYLPFTGGSLSGDLSLKVLKSDVLDGSQIINAGNKNQLYFGNPTVDTVYHESGNNHIFSNKGNTSFTIDYNGNVTAKNAVNAGNDSEIGGRIFGKRAVIDTLDLDESKYYPVTIQCNSSYPSTIKVYRTLDASMGVPSYSTHGGGFWCYYEFEVCGSGWGTSHFKAICNYQDESWVKNDIKVIGYDQMARSSNVVIYLRGGSKYWFDVNSTSVPMLHTSPFTVHDETVEPTKSRIWSGGILLNANANDIQKAVNGLENTLRNHVTLNDVQTITARKVISKDLGTNDYISVAQHNAQFQIGKSSDGKSLEFAVTDDGIAYIQSKEVGVGYNPLILNRSNSGGVAVGGLPISGKALTVNGSIYSGDGYYKAGLDNNYVLLGGGGHKALSDFARNDFQGYQDNRIIYPSEIATQKLQFGFTSWNNDGTAPWADFLHFGGYSDPTGGEQNLIVFKRYAGFGIRQYQGSWQGSNQYSDYVDYWHSGNFNPDNKVNKSGDTMTGVLNLKYLNSLALNGGQIINAANSDELYLGNPSVANVFFESGNNNLFHNRTGYGVGVIWDAHNFNPDSKISINDADAKYISKGIIFNSNFDSIYGSISGIYRADSAGLGAKYLYAPMLHMGGNDTKSQLQIQYANGDDAVTGELSYRGGFNNFWGAWRTAWDNVNLSPVTLDTPQTIKHQKTFNQGIGLTSGQKINLAGYGDSAHYIQRFNDDSDGFGISAAFSVKPYNNENVDIFRVGINGNVTLSGGGKLDGYGNLTLQHSQTGGNATGIWWEKIDDTDKIAGIGSYTENGQFGYFYLGWGSQPWVQKNNLTIGNDIILYKNNIVYHAGNFDPNGYQIWVNNQLVNYFNKIPINYIGASHDLNTLSQTGFYTIAGGTLNSGNYTGPRDGQRALLHFETENVYSASQIQTERYNGNIVSRAKADGGWSHWVRHWGDNDFTAADVSKWNNTLSKSSASEEVILEDDTLTIQPDEFSLEGSGAYDIGSRKKLVHVLFREGEELNIREPLRRQTIVVFNFSKDRINLNIDGLRPYPLSPGMQVTLYISDEREVLLYNETGFKKLQ